MVGVVKATMGPKRPLVPGLRVPLISRRFIGTVQNMACVNMLRLGFWLVRGLRLG